MLEFSVVWKFPFSLTEPEATRRNTVAEVKEWAIAELQNMDVDEACVGFWILGNCENNSSDHYSEYVKVTENPRTFTLS